MRAALTVLAAVTLTACSEEPKGPEEFYGMTDRQFVACEALLNGSAQMFGSDPQARQALAQQVNTLAQQAGGELAEAGNTLLVDWNRGVDTFGRECVDLGWPTQ